MLRKFLILVAITFNLSSRLDAQVGPIDPPPPPSISSQSPGGVQLPSGAYSAEYRDLSVGGQGNAGLELTRSYNSGVASEYSIYAGFAAQGWSHNWAMRISISAVPAPAGLNDPGCSGGILLENCNENQTLYYHSVILSNRSIKFHNSKNGSLSGNNVGSYLPLEGQGAGTQLIFTGTHNDGHFTFIDRDGSRYKFRPLSAVGGALLERIDYPDGTVHNLIYSGRLLKLVKSSRGYGLLFQYGNAPSGTPTLIKACSLSLAFSFVDETSACPPSAPFVEFTYSQSAIIYANGSITADVLAGAADVTGGITAFTYDDGGHVNCIKRPGSSNCQLSLTYSHCEQDPAYSHVPGALYPGLHLNEKVRFQQFINGRTLTYSFPASSICPGQGDVSGGDGIYWFDNRDNERTTIDIRVMMPIRLTDPLGQIRTVNYASLAGVYLPSVSGGGLPIFSVDPGGKVTEIGYDNRGNTVLVKLKSRINPGDTQSTNFSFSASCSSQITCNKPNSVTDQRGNVTSYQYDPIHGGLLRQKMPSDSGGVLPVTRYGYVQRSAWILASGGGYVQASAPVWLLVTEKSCRTSATNGDSCAGGASDEVTVTYEYGPDSGPNNLLVRGKAVTAGGQTLRTCYTYDTRGNRISETSPLAGLAVCP